MTKILNDNVQVDLTIGEQDWLVSEAEVELSRISTPNYAKMIITPDPTEIESLPNENRDISQLIGAPLRLEADNELISERDTGAEEDSLLFSGNLANISPLGDRLFEALAYDPSQQGFTTLGEDVEGEQSETGSLLNQTITLDMPEQSYVTQTFESQTGTSYSNATISATELIRRIAQENLGLSEEDIEITLQEGGTTLEGPEGEYTAGFEETMRFEESEITIRKALEQTREQTKSEWWFDKEGVFHFGVPEPVRHDISLITDTDAGKTTPPYQSVKVIGSGSASQEGYSRNSMQMEDEIVVQRQIALDSSGDTVVTNIVRGEPSKPQFTYRNASINTQEQANNTARKLLEDLAEQQSEGKITVVGFPEIEPMDGVNMPQAKDPEARNYNERQPMGGSAYGVYKVVHRLNNSDGFITIIHVAGVIGPTRTVVAGVNANPETQVTSSATLQDQIE